MATLRFLGGTGTVTGSKFLLDTGQANLLVDCGLFQGFKNLRLRNWAPLPVDPASIDAVLLTHAHIDHSGYLPVLVRNGFRGPIHCTRSTRDLCRILLPDSAWLQEEQARDANRFGSSRHRPALPLYTRGDAERALARFSTVAYGEEFSPCRGVRARFTPAGHILGAAAITVRVDGRAIVFSGDLGRSHDALMNAPQPIEHADVLVLESTYGNRVHDPADAEAGLGEAIAAAAARGGTIVVPTFAVGRAQALLLHLHRLKAAGKLPRALPIYLDSPMATSVTGLYLRARGEHRLDESECRAISRTARIVSTPGESRALHESEWPKVILAGSGMAAGGRVLHHIRRFGPDPRALILFAGFQAGGTRGDALVRGAPFVKIFGEQVPIRCRVANLDNLSAHADRDEIVAWLRHFRAPPARTFLVHGEPAAADALRLRIAESLGWEAEVPDYLATADLGAVAAATKFARGQSAVARVAHARARRSQQCASP